MEDTEKNFEADIEKWLIADGGWIKGDDSGYDGEKALDLPVLLRFIQTTQPKEWDRFERACQTDPGLKFYRAFEKAVNDFGMVHVLRHGFKITRGGFRFKVCYFKPESELNERLDKLYSQNICHCARQWHYSAKNTNSVDLLLSVNGIPLAAVELKNQLRGQSIEQAKEQWMYDRDNREPAFQLNHRVLVFFCADLYNVAMTTALQGENTIFLPFNQGSAGAGNDGGKGNPENESGGYVTSYLWEKVLQKDSFLDLIQKFISWQADKKRLIFPRYHQMDAVRKLIADVREHGAGRNYLIQHSAGSGKSNSIAWLAYRLASLHNSENIPIFKSVILVTDRTVLDSQLQETVTSFDHTLGSVVTIDEKKNSRDLLEAINKGSRIIVTTLQKFPVIYEEVEKPEGKAYAIIVDEAHSSQTGRSAAKLKAALADTTYALEEYAEREPEEEEPDAQDILLKEMATHGKHQNLSFFAFTATPKNRTLEIFGAERDDGSYHPFHIYSMKQAIEEEFIKDVLANYTTFKNCWRIVKNTPDNPDVPESEARKAIKRYKELHPYNIDKKSEIIVETFRDTTSKAIAGKGKMMVVTSSRLAAVRYSKAIKNYICEKGYQRIGVFTAFSGSVTDPDEPDVEYTEAKLNFTAEGKPVSEAQTKKVFHDEGSILIVAEKYQTGFDEPLLHTMIVDKKLRGVKAVQTLSRVNRIYPGKENTYILDFANTTEDIEEAFQPFYRETSLSGEIDIDLIYKTRDELLANHVFDASDIERVASIYIEGVKKKVATTQGMITNALLPVVSKYRELNANARYVFRRKMRSFIKWYGYIAQITRLFDRELHKQWLFCSYLANLLPDDDREAFDLNNRVRLEYYKLEDTFRGSIALSDDKNPLVPAESKGPEKKPEDKKSPLEEIIAQINDIYQGEFTAGDRVIIGVLHDKLASNEKLKRNAQRQSEGMFVNNIFRKPFEEAAMEAYKESEDSYRDLFEDEAKYNAIMKTLAVYLYKEFQEKKKWLPLG